MQGTLLEMGQKIWASKVNTYAEVKHLVWAYGRNSREAMTNLE
jgi:hypothetical protein